MSTKKLKMDDIGLSADMFVLHGWKDIFKIEKETPRNIKIDR